MKPTILIVLLCVLMAYSVNAQYSFPACSTPWTPPSAAGYPGGTQVSHKNANYQAKWSTTAEPGTNGDWAMISKCGDGGLGPNYSGPQRVIGYLPYWVPNFDFKAFDPGTVNHINIAFNLFRQNNNNYNSADFASIAWGEFHNFKVDSILFDNGVLSRAHAKGVTVSVAIGGATDFAFLWLLTQYYNNDAKLEEMANFITNYVTTKGIDGVDLDLECWWPDATISGTTEQGGRVRGDKWGGPDAGPHPAAVGLTKLAQKLRQKMPTKLLSAAVFATSYYGNNYDDALAQHLDWLGLMTYDFTGSWNTSPVGPHASLYKVPLGTYQGQSADNPIYSAEDALEYWMGFAPAAWNHDGGFNVAKAKLVIGVPFYGYDLATRKPNNANGFVAPKWNEIVAAYPNAATSYDPLDTRQLGGYIGADGKKIYYETPKGAAEKIKHTKNFGHQGVIIWELTGDVPYSSSSSLLKAINDAAGNVVNPPPTVSITSPANNATFSAGSNITINASASDNVSVSKVEFFNGGTKLGEDTSSPYSYAWTNVSSGSYVLTAKATDNQNAATTSSAVNITVGSNASPTASITSPANNTSYTAPATVTINASASDTDGTVSKVDFYNGSTLLGTDTSSPYSFSWTNVAAGTYSLTAKATDNLGAATTSSAINITVSGPAGLPAPWQSGDIGSVTASGSATYSSGTFTVKGSGADIWGTVDGFHYVYQPVSGNVEIVAKVNSLTNTNAWAKAGVMIRETLNANSTHAMVVATPTTNGVSFQRRTSTGGTSASTTAAGVTIPVWVKISRTGNTFTASRSTDGTTWTTIGTATITMTASVYVGLPVTSHANGTLTTATFSNVTVSGANASPTASITSPANNATFTAPASVTINATASDTDGTISKVDFYNGTTLLGTDTNSPYSYSWTNVAAGSYSLTARATDNAGATGTSGVVSITVSNPSNVNPTASITSPANNASFTAPATVTINATASDTDGTISKVDFYNGATLLGTDTSSPYSFSWTNVAAGSYALTAKSTDNASGTGTSSVVNITVTGGSDACSTTQQYVENGGYVAGSQVKNVGSKYECKPYPFTGWCNGAAWAYAPGTGTYWQDAWTLVGSCTGGAGARTAGSGTQHVASNELNESEILSTDADGLSLFPNPGVSNKEHSITLTFETPPGQLKINLKDINGTEVFSSQHLDVKSKTLKVSVPTIPQGLYILRVRTEKQSWMKKYLVK